MKKITVLCVGKASKQFCRDGCDEYLKRLRSFYDVSVVEVSEQPTIRREGEELIKRLNGECVLLDVGGEQISSEAFAELIKTTHERTDRLTFLIGGASGVDEQVRGICKKRVSFGRVTYPHQIARLLLLEQIYRAATIINGLPYHK